MSEWHRETTRLTLDRIRPEIAAAIQAHITSYNLGPILEDALLCIETVSTRKRRRLFDAVRDRETVQVVLVTPTWLIIGVRGEKPESATALSVRLAEAEFQEHAEHPTYALVPDSGIHVSGSFTGRVGMQGRQRITSFVPLGEGPAAASFRAVLAQAVQATRK